MQAFAFIDVANPAVAWAVMRGVLVSADQVPEASTSFVSFMVGGLIQYQLNWRLSNETIIEHVRSKYFPQSTSRVRGLYFFESDDLARKAIEENWGGHFKLENLVELQLHPSGAITRVDANWITCAPRTPDNRLDVSDLSWIGKYWDGQPYSDQPTWELIANGEARITTVAARAKAYEIVKQIFPASWEFMEMSRLAAEVGSDGGLITPFVRRISANRFSLDYVLHDAPFQDPDVIEKMTKHPNWARLAAYAKTNIEKDLILPDFRPWGQEFSMTWQEATNLNLQIASAHHT